MDRWIDSLPPQWTHGCGLAVFACARSAYASPGRHHHTWEHVEECVAALVELDGVAVGRAAFLALVFHDAVYRPGDPDNERSSADFALEILARDSDAPAMERESVRRIILATRDHQANAPGLMAYERAALDADLSTLGASWERYRRYARDVMREYCPGVVSEADFRIGRASFLRKLLAAPHIYATPEGRARWEAAARANIARELDERLA